MLGGAIVTIALAALATLFAFFLGASGEYPRVGRSPPLQRLSAIALVMALAALLVIVAGSALLPTSPPISPGP